MAEEEKMAKGKGKNNNSDALPPLQSRELRSRKRECPRDEISETDQVQPTLHLQDTGINDTVMDATVLQCQQPPLEEFTMISTQPHQTKQSCLRDEEEKHAGAISVPLKYVKLQAIEEQEEALVTDPDGDSQLEGLRTHTDNDANQSEKDKEEIHAEENHRLPSPTVLNQLQVLLPTSEETNESNKATVDTKENSLCNLERNQKISLEESNDVYMADGTEVTKGVPAKKKRRMGMCGLTEKERSHFLQTQKRENWQNGPAKPEKQICSNNADLVVQEEVLCSSPLPLSVSIPEGSVTDQNEAETKLQSSLCGEAERAETAVCTSDGTSALCEPGCPDGNSYEAEEGIVPGPEQAGDTSDRTEDELLGKQLQELEGRAAESVAENPLQQMKDEEDGAAVEDQTPAIYSSPTEHEETKSGDADRAAHLQVNGVTRTKDELTGDTGDRSSSTVSHPGGFHCGTVELCKAAASSGGSERKDSCDPDNGPGAGLSALHTEHPQTRDIADPFGSGYLDYVSDSQLNTIALTEEEMMEREEVGSPDCPDATDLICGLIRELSSLNRKVMATHRELENLRRSSKSSRTSIR